MNMLKRIVVWALLLGIVNCLGINTRRSNRNKNNNVKEKAYLKVYGQGWNIHVTMHVFSGRQDPTWFIPDTHPSYRAILRNMGTIPTGHLPSKLGYKGFSLVHLPPGQKVANGGHVNRTVTSLPDWEMMLLETSEGVGDNLRAHAKQTILTSNENRKRRSDPLSYYPDYDFSSLFGSPTTADPLELLTDNDMLELAELWGLDKRFKNITTTPPPLGPTKFEPEKWNSFFVQEHNNCYNYANNRITDTFAQPGRAGECEMSSALSHGTEIEKLAKCDGLQGVNAPDSDTLPSFSWNLVALVFWPPEPGSDEFDFHWYRLDGDGHWSHKPGKTSATNLDQSNNTISDPRFADRGPYKEFVGFMQTRRDKIILI